MSPPWLLTGGGGAWCHKYRRGVRAPPLRDLPRLGGLARHPKPGLRAVPADAAGPWHLRPAAAGTPWGRYGDTTGTGCPSASPAPGDRGTRRSRLLPSLAPPHVPAPAPHTAGAACPTSGNAGVTRDGPPRPQPLEAALRVKRVFRVQERGRTEGTRVCRMKPSLRCGRAGLRRS